MVEEMGSAELIRWLNRLELDMQGIRNDIRTLTFVHPDVYNANREADQRWHDAMEKRIDMAEEGKRTLTRGVMLALVAAAVNVIFMLAMQGVGQ